MSLPISSPRLPQAGRNYYLDDRVQALELRASTLYAEVQGTGSEPYYCEIILQRRGSLIIHGNCTCPIGYNCKHVAAALYAWSQQGSDKTQDGLEQELQHWLERLERTQRAADAGTAAEPDQLLYVLDTDVGPADKPRFAVTPYKVRQLKKGGYGKPQLFRGQSGRFLNTTDYGLLARLRNNSKYGRYYLSDNDGAALLRDLIGTGRCHWQSLDTPPLSAGPTRNGRFEWIAGSDGEQQLQLHIDGDGLAIDVSPPWYLDPNQHLCGPVATPYGEALTRALLEAPPIPAEQAVDFSERLARLPGSERLPHPHRWQRQTRGDIAPRPILRLDSPELDQLFTQTLGSLSPHELRLAFEVSDERWLHRARLEFDYAGHRIEASDTHEHINARDGDTLLSIRRQTAQEEVLQDQLLDCGLVRLGRLGFVPPEPAAWADFMLNVAPQLRAAGWRIEVAPDFQFQLADAEDWYAELEEATGEDWFGLDLGVVVDGERINLLPILADILRDLPPPSELRDEQVVLAPLEDGRLLPVPARRVKPMLQTLLELYDGHSFDEQGRLQLSHLHSPALAELNESSDWHWSGGEALIEFGRRLSDFDGIQAVEPPTTLNAELRDYQRRGLDWLQFLRSYQLNGILADDMGLGKTVQTLAHVLTEKAAGRADRPSLIVMPTSLLSNWRHEAQRLAPSLKTLTLHGAQRQALLPKVPQHDLVFTTYTLLSRDLEALQAYDYHLLVLDEAQNIKNPRARAAAAARELNARHRLCLTGTPLENNLGELWSLFHFLMPGLLGSREQFRRLFRTPIEKHNDPDRRARLRRRVAPFLLRRTKEAVASELPGKTEVIRTVELSNQQRDLYETVRLAMHERIQSEVARKGLNRSHIVILDALLKLRQICCDPRLVKLEAATQVKGSAKLDLLKDMLPELISEGRRILLFSQFTSMLNLIEVMLKEARIPYVKLTGNTRDRETPVQQFQAGAVPLFLISLKAGGTGLNLTAADTVIHYDPWWNPAVERQATDRAYRIGQDKPVFVYKLITEGTVEEKIATLQERKQALSDALLAEGQGATALTAADLEDLFAPVDEN
ncbi:hypothetical protein CAI21_15500 [Alkalilimnicola ehrlichii]|uniref:Helicase n=1 Tax=Alkalilimnicola ehrlichii TaxID=351052 RepID=A0A3E0WNW3_9GAMM|nr:DEAD/DEAH box helicase [Alkalilimnicola ehrlichii]RFA26971.1 hypothetical protein CAI21_15500 [Alkalilimnicola ehrlichii]RFA34089.1 hypothetical protein CAL65_15635 [Alkalilimnicola ehrlichii]